MHLGRFVCTKLFLLHLLLLCCGAKTPCHEPPSCGQILNISYPFGLKGDPRHCGGKPVVQLECDNNNNTILYWEPLKLHVLEINYQNNTSTGAISIRVVDAGLLQRNDCSSLPFPSLIRSFHLNYGFYWYPRAIVLYLSCEKPVDSIHYIDTRPCTHGFYNPIHRSPMERQYYSYVLLGNRNFSEIADSCRLDMVVPSSSPTIYTANLSYADIHKQLLYGFQLSYSVSSCGFWCYLTGCLIYAGGMIVLLLVAERLCGPPVLLAFVIYKWRRRHLSMFDMVEDFLQSQNNLMPIKYSFSEITKMTSGFKNKLGEGGYGSVYKGKLRSGRVVAVKILGKSKCNGQEFINEVATIGRIHHAHVVQLIGFCAERSKRALVYEFMANGSLEKYIFSEDNNTSLSYKKMYEISIGVARGIEYLHKGCDMQILHFDIKPHNILLDENFTSKVSDFGLAKLYPIDDSMVPRTAARGTMGYMAPELFYKNIGGISYKADVYSFGMLLMEMVSRRKNSIAFAEHSSQSYMMTSWVFNQLSLEKEINNGEITDEEKEIVKKMAMVSLWCIQFNPRNRPSMNKVIEMLEDEAERLQMPPTPFNLE